MPPPDAAFVQWAQVLAPLIAAVAAIASWRSASASLRTAGRADETSRRAREALSRATRPEFMGGLSHHNERESQPQPMALYLFNRTVHPGRVISIRVRAPDGRTLADVRDLSIEVGGSTEDSNPQVYVPLETVARVRPNPRRVYTQTGEVITEWSVEYTDAGDLATWRQHGRTAEAVRFDDSTDTPIYRYDDQGSSVPELVPGSGTAPPRRWWQRQSPTR